MEDLNELTNEELQYRLAQFGAPNLPVTSTTRKVLIKRLRGFIENEKSKLRRDTEYLTRYSSDEDMSSTANDKLTQSIRNRGRSTISTNTRSIRSTAKMSPPPPVNKSNNFTWNDKSQNTVKSTNSIYISPLIQHETDEEVDLNDGSSTSFSKRFKNNSSTRSTSIYNGHDSHSSLHNKNRYLNESMENRSQNNNALNTSNESSTNVEHDSDDLSSPYSSTNFTKRLLSLRNRNLGSTLNASPSIDSNRYSQSPLLNYPSSRVTRYLNETASSSRHSILSRDSNIIYQANLDNSNRQPFSIRKYCSEFFNRQYERYSVKQSLVPCILLSALFIFFTSVIIAYLTMNPDLSLALDAKAATYKLCPENVQQNIGTTYKPTINCIEMDQLNAAFHILKLLIPELQKRIEHNRCNDANAAFAMSAKEVVQFLYEAEEQSVIDISRALHNAEYLISMNPQWRVEHFIDDSGQIASIISINQLIRLRSSQSNYFAIVKPRLPVSCFLYNKLQAIFAIIGWIVIIMFALLVIAFICRFIRIHLQTRRERITNLVEEIKNVLMEKAYDPDTACTDAASVVIIHLRDKLIAPAERNKMESVWNAALKQIENDSRVQFSIATRKGEDYRVMRWIDTISSTNQNAHFSGNTLTANTSNNSINNIATTSTTASTSNPINVRACSNSNAFNIIKRWQSPAFDKSNKIKDPPTECLKIRQMFDKHESSNANLKQIIQDAILEKVAHTTCKIYDLQLDKQTCCVYVRCATPKDAGIIHDEVNGWWFDSRLVSIKFLRLDRYLSRFPNAANGPAYLKPSNTKNLSMTNGDGELKHQQNGKRAADNLTDYEDDDDVAMEDDGYFIGGQYQYK